MSPERRYRLLLLTYPRSYRDARADEMLDVLLAAEERRGPWSGLPEAASLVTHGILQRLRLSLAGARATSSPALAGASLVCLLAVLGAQQLLRAGLRGLGWDGSPDEWGLHVLWVDPRWPVHTLWVLTGLALLLRRDGWAVACAWAGALAHAWHLVAAAEPALPWPGNIGPHWIAPGGSSEAAWLLLSVAVAALLGGRGRLARARTCLAPHLWWAVVAVGLVGVTLVALVTATVGETTGLSALGPTGSSRAVLPLVLGATVLAAGLLRAPHGRGALFLLAALAIAPLVVRWSTPMAVPGAAVALLAAGLAVTSGPWGRRSYSVRP